MKMSINQKELVQYLVKRGIIKSKDVIMAMENVDRKYYAPKSPYIDSPQYIGFGATISAPHMHGYALQYLEKQLKTAKHVLDVGSGTGYLTTAMALMTSQNCQVYGIQHVPQLVTLSLQNIKKDKPEFLKNNKIRIKEGDGRKGWEDQKISFDVIHVGAAADKIPQKLLEQLAEGGRMILPVGQVNQVQKFMAIDKKQGIIKQTILELVQYVPLTDLSYQLKRF